MQQIDFTLNLDCDGETTVLFILEKVRESVLGFSQVIVRVLQMLL